jgi:hypothetical protein
LLGLEEWASAVATVIYSQSGKLPHQILGTLFNPGASSPWLFGLGSSNVRRLSDFRMKHCIVPPLSVISPPPPLFFSVGKMPLTLKREAANTVRHEFYLPSVFLSWFSLSSWLRAVFVAGAVLGSAIRLDVGGNGGFDTDGPGCVCAIR